MTSKEIWGLIMITISLISLITLLVWAVITQSKIEKERKELENKKTRLQIKKLEKELKE